MSQEKKEKVVVSVDVVAARKVFAMFKAADRNSEPQLREKRKFA